MHVGHARYCLSPTAKEFYLIGFRSPTRQEPALGIHDDIYSNALLLRQDDHEVFIFSADFLEFEETMAEDVKTLLNERFGIDRDAVLLSATHNHSSVVSYHKGWYTKKFDADYYEFLLNVIVKSFAECRNNLQEATARYGRKTITGYYGNRNHPGELADNEVIVLTFFDKTGKPFASLVNWAVHSTVISPSNRYLSSDWAGEVSKQLGSSWEFYPAIIVGAAADSSNRNERQGNDFEELARVATGMANEIQQIELDKELTFSKISIQTLYHTIHYDPRKMQQANREAIKRYQVELQNTIDKERSAFVKKEIQKLSEHLNLTEVHLEVKASVISLGQLQLFVFPGELGSAFGKAIKGNYPDLSLILGYANGYYGYFLPAKEYGLSFETIGTLIPAGESEKIIQKFLLTSNLLKTFED